jgi:hypothetical protein
MTLITAIGFSHRSAALCMVTLLAVTGCGRGDVAKSREAAAPQTVATPVTAQTAAAGAPAGKAVQTIEAKNQSASYALVASTCERKPCAASIELVANGTRLDSFTLEMAASDPKLEEKASDDSFGTNRVIKSWTAGEEEGAVTTALQSVQLTPRLVGLLLHQAGGFEHVKRRRDLFIVVDNKLKRVWSIQDGAGPVRSLVDVVGREDRGEDIVLIQGMAYAPNESDRVTAKRFTWDESVNALKEIPIDSLAATVVGSFNTAALARNKLADECFSRYWVINDQQLGATKSRFVLALLSAETSSSSAEMNRECLRKTKPRLATFRPMKEKP